MKLERFVMSHSAEPLIEEKFEYLPQVNRATEHLANERTFLAWIRTSIAVVSFGFVTGKLNLMLPFLAGQTAGTNGVRHKFPVGLLMVGFGGLLALLSAWRYFIVARAIERGVVRPAWSVISVISFIVALLAAVMFFYMLTKPEMM